MTKKELEEATEYLLANPKQQMSQFHDAGSCWQLIHHLVGLVAHYEKLSETMFDSAKFNQDNYE